MKGIKVSRKQLGNPFLYGLVLALMVLLLFSQSAAGQATEPQSWDVTLILDQSGSMHDFSDPCFFEPDENDYARPVDLPLRQWAAIKFIDFLGVDPVGRDRVGILYFGTEPGESHPRFEATDPGESDQAQVFLKKNNCPPDLSWTNVNKALESAYNEMIGLDGDRQKLVILLTDGKPELADPWAIEDEGGIQGKRNYYIRHFELLEQYRQAGIKLFIIALGENAQLEDPDLAALDVLPDGARRYRDLWNHAAEVTDGEYYKVDTSDQLWATYRAIAAKLARVFPDEIITGATPGGIHEVTFAVGEARRLVVTVDRGNQTETTLFDPGGQSHEPIRADEYYEMYNFTDPESGRWILRFEGEPTRYEVSILPRVPDLNIEVANWPRVYPAGKPLPIVITVTNDQGQPLDNALVGVTVTGEGGYERSISMPFSDIVDSGMYEGGWTDTNRPGDYTFVFQANEGDKRSEHTERITLDTLLYLEHIGPEQGASVEEPVAYFAIMRGGERVPADTPGINLTAELFDGASNLLAAPSISPEPDGSFSVRAEGSLEEGDYTIGVSLDVPEEGGIVDEKSVTFSLMPPTADVTAVSVPPACNDVSFGELSARPSDVVPLTTSMNTSPIEGQIVVSAEAQISPATPVTLAPGQVTLAGGSGSAPVELQLQVPDSGAFQPGLNALTGTIGFRAQDGTVFCTMPFTLNVLKARMFLAQPNPEGRAGDSVNFEVDYDTSGESANQTVNISLAGVPPDLIHLEEGAEATTFPADRRAIMDIPVVIESAAEPGAYQGQMTFTYDDGRQDTSEFSLTVLEPAWGGWPILIALALLVIAIIIFILIDPFCWRCSLSGSLVFNTGQGTMQLAGRKQVVNVPGSSLGGAGPAAQLVLRARKGGVPVVAVKQASGNVLIDGNPYPQGAKNIELPPDASIEVGSVVIKYENLMAVPDGPMPGRDVFDSAIGSDPYTDSGDYSESLPIDDYDDQGYDRYDRGPDSSDQGGDDDAFGDLDYG